MHCLYTGVYQGNEAASKDLNCWRNKTKMNQKFPKPNQTKQKKEKLEKNLSNKLLALGASHSIWVHHLPVNPWLRRYESHTAPRKSFL